LFEPIKAYGPRLYAVLFCERRIIIKLLVSMFQGNPQKRYMFFCDCASAVDTVDKMQFITRPDIFTKFNDIRHKLHYLSITVKIVKIKSLRNFRK